MGENKMEPWEVRFRIKCDKELDNGLYEIGGPGMKAFTGKGGYIEYLVALEKSLRGERDKLSKEIVDNPPVKVSITTEQEEKFKKLIEDVMYTLNK